MERQIKIWGVLAASGVVLASLVYLMTTKHAPVFLSTAAAFFVMMFFVLVGRVASLKNRITELKEDVQMYRTLSQGPLPSYQEPQVEQVVQPAPNHTVSIMPEDDKLSLEEWTRKKEEQEHWRRAGFTQGHMKPLPYPTINSHNGWYKTPEGYKRRK